MKRAKRLFGLKLEPETLPDSSTPTKNTAFPVEKLIVAGPGRLSCTAHRNNDNPLHLDWSFSVGFEPVDFLGKSCDTGINIEIETKNIRRIEQFSGMERHQTNSDGTFGLFYLFDCRD
jgi:hypothetical protein